MRKARVFLGVAIAFGLVLSACGGGKAPTPAATPTPTLKATPTPTPQPATPTQPPATPTPTPPPPSASPAAGKTVFEKSGCVACHIVAGVFTMAPAGLAPELTKIGTVAATRKSGVSAEAYIRESLAQPAAFVVPGFQPIMPPPTAGISPTGQQLEDLIAYLLSLK